MNSSAHNQTKEINYSWKAFTQVAKDNFIFSLPLLAGQVGQMLFGVADVFVAGHYSQIALASLGLASGFMSPFFMLGLGILNAIGALSAYDKGKGVEGHRFFSSALMAGMLVGFIVWPLTLAVLPLYNVFGLNPELHAGVREYLIWCSPSIVCAFVFQALKEYLQAHGKTYFANGSILFFNLINLGLNFLLAFGYGIIPGMGIKGLALATFCTRFLLMAVTLFYALKTLKMDFKEIFQIDLQSFKEIFKLGFPLGLGVLTEVLVFCTVTLLIGKMETVYSAAHNLVLTLASLTFMLPLALSSAAGVKVAHAKGRNDYLGIVYNGFSCSALALFFMTLTAIIYFSFPHFIVSLSTHDEELIRVSGLLLYYVGIFQLPDGIQITMWGALRGLGKARAPLIICLICHWFIGLPMGYYFAFIKGMKAQGLWLGLTIGLFTLASGLSLLWLNILKKERALYLAN